jgi:carbon-monoxide dehydrogenase small subunit
MTIARHTIRITVNGIPYERSVEPRLLLSDFLRHELDLTGTHVGCEHGVCGMCTILLDERTARACLTFAVQADGCRIRTVEGLGAAGALHPVQEAFWEKHGLQCGYCTPAMLLTAIELLETNPNPSREEIREAVGSNLCRCTGYQTIVEAIELGARRLAAGQAPAAATALAETERAEEVTR